MKNLSLLLFSSFLIQSITYEISAPVAKHFLGTPLSNGMSRERVERQREVMHDRFSSFCTSISSISSVSMNINNTHGFILAVHPFPFHVRNTAMKHPNVTVCP